jgi:hypothetical protein
MQIIRTIVWVVLLLALLLFSFNNWNPVDIKIWENLVLETKLPLLVVGAFLLGLAPMWLRLKADRWRMNRRINTLENAAKSVMPSAALTSTQLANAQHAAAEHSEPAN